MQQIFIMNDEAMQNGNRKAKSCYRNRVYNALSEGFTAPSMLYYLESR